METKNIYQSIAAIMAEVEPIAKSKKNQQQGFLYRGIDDIYNSLQPLFAKHNVFITSEVLELNREERQTKGGGLLMYTLQKIKFTFYAADGSNISSVITGEAMDSGDKSANKSLSIALKYCLMQLLLIPTEDLKIIDPDKESHEVNAAPPKETKEAKPPVKNGLSKKPAPVDEIALNHWRESIMHCNTVNELLDLFNSNKAIVNSDPGIYAMFTERRKFLQTTK